MRITFSETTPARSVNEQSSFTVTARVWDDSGDTWLAQVPTSLRYRIDDWRGVECLGWTTLTAAASNAIAMPYSANVINDTLQPFEDKILQVQANSGLASQYSESFPYRVRNVFGIT